MYLIMLGTNDAKPYNWNRERYERELDVFVRRYTGLEQKPRVILMTPPTCFPDPKTGAVGYDIDGKTIDLYTADIVRREGAALGIEVIDLHAYTDGHPEWFADGVHPNFEGNRQIGTYIAERLGLREK